MFKQPSKVLNATTRSIYFLLVQRAGALINISLSSYDSFSRHNNFRVNCFWTFSSLALRPTSSSGFCTKAAYSAIGLKSVKNIFILSSGVLVLISIRIIPYTLFAFMQKEYTWAAYKKLLDLITPKSAAVSFCSKIPLTHVWWLLLNPLCRQSKLRGSWFSIDQTWMAFKSVWISKQSPYF